MKYNPQLGLAGKSMVGKAVKAVEETKVVRGASKVKDFGYAVNASFEQPFVRSLYIKLAREKAKQLLKAQKQPMNESAILYKMEEIKNVKSLHEPIIKKVQETLPVFDLTGPLERKWLRGAMPFYNWYKFMAQYAARLPKNHPFKTIGARGLGGLSEAERETAFKQMFPFMEGYISENGIPDRYDNLWPVSQPDKNGEAIFFNARGINPFTTIQDFIEGDVVNMLSPVLKLGIERAQGRDAFTGRKYRTGEKGEGEFKEFEKENPPLGDHILRMFSQYQLAKETRTPGRQWDSGTLLNPDPILDKITGEYKYPIKSVDRILNFIGVDRKTVNINKSWNDFQRNRQRAIGETFQKRQLNPKTHVSQQDLKELMDWIRVEKPEKWKQIIKDIERSNRMSGQEKLKLMRKIK
jgi:hypothetical protein